MLWGQKALSNYLGADKSRWEDWDASVLMSVRAHPAKILVDQGEADAFLERELHPHARSEAGVKSSQKLELRRRPGYDHGYFFIQTVIEDHIRHHHQTLSRSVANGKTQ